jgi:hypothetical protein
MAVDSVRKAIQPDPSLVALRDTSMHLWAVPLQKFV